MLTHGPYAGGSYTDGLATPSLPPPSPADVACMPSVCVRTFAALAGTMLAGGVFMTSLWLAWARDIALALAGRSGETTVPVGHFGTVAAALLPASSLVLAHSFVFANGERIAEYLKIALGTTVWRHWHPRSEIMRTTSLASLTSRRLPHRL